MSLEWFREVLLSSTVTAKGKKTLGLFGGKRLIILNCNLKKNSQCWKSFKLYYFKQLHLNHTQKNVIKQLLNITTLPSFKIDTAPMVFLVSAPEGRKNTIETPLGVLHSIPA